MVILISIFVQTSPNNILKAPQLRIL